ncbi:Crt homolog 1 (Chloroquine resistance transporter paralog 1) (DdCRTp1) [Durusdinium trenchii]|uniref:Crt homolog 1 (Chloroquine resistance transporter paralog 1) (DdCRTp1) n=1 Tax=Durusdinium trenchii TaxID=1381693 RepID=A0ABP0IFR3_9DINO
MLVTNVVTKEMMTFPKRHFVIMGTLDSLGTFLTCLGTAYTPGSVTPLLNQLLIPFTMLVSTTWLGIASHWKERCGAFLIVVGACISVLPKIVDGSNPMQSVAAQSRWYAILFYALSNFPMAASSCYKEATFENIHLDVWYLTQWVSIWQFVVSFVYMPLLVLPGFSSKEGMTISDVMDAFADGWTCYTQQDEACARGGAFLLLTGYCGVNVCFNTLGLYLTKHGSAVLNALSYSMLLPFTTALFFTPLLGPYQEPLTRDAYFTFVGLVTVLIGFAIYQLYSQNVGEAPRRVDTPILSPTPTCPSGALLEEFLERPPSAPSIGQWPQICHFGLSMS